MAEPDSTLRMAADLQQKFHFYLVGLTFGILALSVQTASFDSALVARGAELLGWLSLLASGLFGLWRLEGVPHFYQVDAALAHARDRVHLFTIRKAEGVKIVTGSETLQDYRIDELIETAKNDVATLEAGLPRLRKRTEIKYKVQRATLVLGLLALILSRGLDPVLDIVNASRP